VATCGDLLRHSAKPQSPAAATQVHQGVVAADGSQSRYNGVRVPGVALGVSSVL